MHHRIRLDSIVHIIGCDQRDAGMRGELCQRPLKWEAAGCPVILELKEIPRPKCPLAALRQCKGITVLTLTD